MKIYLVKLLADLRLTVSRSEGRRVVCMGLVTLNGEPVTDIETDVDVNIGDVVRVGKRKEITITQEILDNGKA